MAKNLEKKLGLLDRPILRNPLLNIVMGTLGTVIATHQAIQAHDHELVIGYFASASWYMFGALNYIMSGYNINDWIDSKYANEEE